jgi:hypothetical protein
MRASDLHDPAAPGSLRRRLLRTAACLAGLLAAAAIVAACSQGSPGPGVANVASSASGASSPGGSASPDPLAFARCMRAHGVTDYPDSGVLLGASPGTDLDYNNPTYRAARQACQSLRPVASLNPAQQAQANANQLKFAHCMRQHGITKYPDPDRDRVDLRGIDLNSPQFKAAQQACRQYLGPNDKGAP